MHSGPFVCLTKLDAKWAELVQKFLPRCHVGIFNNERILSLHWALNLWFCAFRIILVHLGPFGCLTKLGAKRAELVQKFVPRSRIGNSCFGEFCTIWVHLGRFGCLKKLGAKRSELVQNFVPRSRI